VAQTVYSRYVVTLIYYFTAYTVGMASILMLGVWGWSVLANWPKVQRQLLLLAWLMLFILAVILLLLE